MNAEVYAMTQQEMAIADNAVAGTFLSLVC